MRGRFFRVQENYLLFAGQNVPLRTLGRAFAEVFRTGIRAAIIRLSAVGAHQVRLFVARIFPLLQRNVRSAREFLNVGRWLEDLADIPIGPRLWPDESRSPLRSWSGLLFG